MPLVGTFSTMPLPDLMQWLGSALKTGTLRVEHERVTITVRVRDGRVAGSSSDDPPQRLGQFLLARNCISEEQLRQALRINEESKQLLGQTLVEMGALTADELLVQLTDKAEEIIHSLFDWRDAVFRFEERVDDRDDVFPVDLRVDDVLLRGLQRYDEMTQIRAKFDDEGIVLRYTKKPPGPEIFEDEALRAMYSAIDGERTLRDVRLHVHGTEYQVNRFLFDLFENRYVEIAGRKQVGARGGPSAPLRAAAPEIRPDLDDLADLDLRPSALDLPPASPTVTASATAEPRAHGNECATATAAATPSLHPKTQHVSDSVGAATGLLDQGQFEAALVAFEALSRAHPGDDALRRLTAEAEMAFIDHTYATSLPPAHIPLLTRPVESMGSESLTPQEFFMLSRIDGSWDVKSIIQVAPFREVEALRTLNRLLGMGVIELCAP